MSKKHNKSCILHCCHSIITASETAFQPDFYLVNEDKYVVDVCVVITHIAQNLTGDLIFPLSTMNIDAGERKLDDLLI